MVANGPLSNQDVTALHALIACARIGQCQFEWHALGEVLATAAERNPARPDILTQYADYAINLAHDYALGLSLMQRAVALAPTNHQYWANLISLQIALGQLDEARRGIDRLREMDRFGSGSLSIAALDASLQQRFGQPGDIARNLAIP